MNAGGDGFDTLPVEGMGAQVRVEVSGQGAVEFVNLLRPLWARCAPRDAADEAQRVAVTLPSGVDPKTLLERTTQQITLALLRQRAGKLMLFHAGGVSHPHTGRSIVYVAPSMTGKTHLTLELARQFGYLSDETIAVDDDLSILPYPKPLSVRDNAGGPRRELGPDALGLAVPPANPQLTGLWLLDRRAGHVGSPEVAELDVFDAAHLLGPQTSSLGRMPAGLHTLDALLRHTGGARKITYRESASLLPMVVDLLGAPDETGPDDPIVEPVVQFVPPVDRIVRPDEALLLYSDNLVRLGQLGVAIVEASVRPIGIAPLVERLTERLGEPEGVDAHEFTADAVEQMIADGVLRRVAP